MQHLKEFNKAFEGLSHGHNRGRVFSDFVEIAALTVHQAPYHAGAFARDEAFEKIERSYLDAINRYDTSEIEQIVTLYATASMGIMENRADFLGAAYMGLEISNERSGQFFTPPEVSRLMADMTFAGAPDISKEKGVITVDEPAAGAGGMLIEASNTLQRLGFDPRMTMYFRATDIDRTCFNMAYFQLSTLGLCGDVVHGNALSLEEWDRRATPQMKIVDAGLAPLRVSKPTARQEPPASMKASDSAPVEHVNDKNVADIAKQAPVKMKPQLEMDFEGYDPSRGILPGTKTEPDRGPER
jgi:N-6 DNA Methylase